MKLSSVIGKPEPISDSSRTEIKEWSIPAEVTLEDELDDIMSDSPEEAQPTKAVETCKEEVVKMEGVDPTEVR